MKFLSLLAGSIMLISCSGYRLGGMKPASLASVKTVAVPMFKNNTLHPRAEVLATSAVANAILQDGTYRIGPLDQSDAILRGVFSSIKYTPIRGTRLDTQLPQELENNVTIQWELVDARDPTKRLASGSSSGVSQLYVDSNLQTARNNALPEALERAAQSLVSRLSNGY
jgi:hypothetical protein